MTKERDTACSRALGPVGCYNGTMSDPVTIFMAEELRHLLSPAGSFLDRAHFRLVTAGTDDAAMEIIRDVKPRVAVLCETGDGKGNRLAAGLKADEATREVVVLLALTGPPGIEPSHDADSVLRDGIDEARLIDRVASLIRLPTSRRRHVRALFGASLNGRTVTGTFLGNTVNISEGGMLIEADRELAIDERVQCKFFPPGENAPIELTVRVIRRAPEVDGAMPAFGVVFEDLSPDNLASLRRFIPPSD